MTLFSAARYCIDTSSLIAAWRESYAKDAFPSFWKKFEPLIVVGEIVAPDEVLQELERQDDDLVVWCRERPEMFCPLDVDLQKVLMKVLNELPNLADHKRTSPANADPFIVALALQRGLTIITQELKNHEIHKACQHYGLRGINILQFIREKGWKF